MKMIVFAIIVNVFGLTLASSYLNPGVPNPRNGDDHGFSSYTTAEYLLVVQYEKKLAEIMDALTECNDTWSVPEDESLELFHNAPPGVIRFTNAPAKCLMDCVMRKDGVMTDEGFQEQLYVAHIKQLRFNYTSYDVNQKSAGQKEMVLNAINRLIGHQKQSYETIETYEWAAHECKDKKDPDNDKCETSWMIARCITNKSRERHFNNPFYPINVRRVSN